MDDPPRDVLGDEPLDEEHDEGYGGPEVLALVAAVLAVLSLAGFGLLNGGAYVVPELVQPGDSRGLLAAGAGIGVVLALVPVALGARAAARLPYGSGLLAVARAAVLLAVLSVVLRLLVLAVTLLSDAPQYVRF